MRIVDAMGERGKKTENRDDYLILNSIFAREEAFQLRSSTVIFTKFFFFPFRVSYLFVHLSFS